MDIKIGKFKLTSDSMNFILTEQIKSKDGKHKGEIVDGKRVFFSSITNVLNYVLKSRLRGSEAKALIELQIDLNRAKNDIAGYFKETI